LGDQGGPRLARRRLNLVPPAAEHRGRGMTVLSPSRLLRGERCFWVWSRTNLFSTSSLTEVGPFVASYAVTKTPSRL